MRQRADFLTVVLPFIAQQVPTNYSVWANNRPVLVSLLTLMEASYPTLSLSFAQLCCKLADFRIVCETVVAAPSFQEAFCKYFRRTSILIFFFTSRRGDRFRQLDMLQIENSKLKMATLQTGEVLYLFPSTEGERKWTPHLFFFLVRCVLLKCVSLTRVSSRCAESDSECAVLSVCVV